MEKILYTHECKNFHGHLRKNKHWMKLLEIVAKAFEDPKVTKEYGQWKRKRETKYAAH